MFNGAVFLFCHRFLWSWIITAGNQSGWMFKVDARFSYFLYYFCETNKKKKCHSNWTRLCVYDVENLMATCTFDNIYTVNKFECGKRSRMHTIKPTNLNQMHDPTDSVPFTFQFISSFLYYTRTTDFFVSLSFSLFARALSLSVKCAATICLIDMCLTRIFGTSRLANCLIDTQRRTSHTPICLFVFFFLFLRSIHCICWLLSSNSWQCLALRLCIHVNICLWEISHLLDTTRCGLRKFAHENGETPLILSANQRVSNLFSVYIILFIGKTDFGFSPKGRSLILT